jgi:hypothetical protein
MDEQLLRSYGDEAFDNVGSAYVFASECIHTSVDFKYPLLKRIQTNQLLDLLVFDLWIENGDRTLSEAFSGNPNLLWDGATQSFFIIDHNLAFDAEFNCTDFWQTHVCRELPQTNQLDMLEKSRLEQRMQQSLSEWDDWWAKIPDEWQEQNAQMNLFNVTETFQRLTTEAQGGIWTKFS